MLVERSSFKLQRALMYPKRHRETPSGPRKVRAEAWSNRRNADRFDAIDDSIRVGGLRLFHSAVGEPRIFLAELDPPRNLVT